jgi:CheY-like chemotaxis protein
MEAIGRLAGGVAHDFNNILTVILGCCDTLQQNHHRDDGESVTLLNEIQQAVERGAEMTRQLLLFSRKQEMRSEALNLNKLISSVVKMLRRLIGDNIEIYTDLEPLLWNVKADPGQIEQVIMNLVINARDAMPKGGKLWIETQNLVLGEQTTGRHEGIPAGAWTTLAVRDEGCGMSEDVLAHVFEPFFTTKEMGKGTGLGLATVFGVVTQSGGHIRVASKPGVGTRFRIYLPQDSETAIADKEAPQTKQPRFSAATILLVEDDSSVRKIAATTLRKAGYTVLEATHGGEALSLLARHTHAINLVVTDVIMPNTTGPKLAAELQLRRPDLKVLYMSGYTDNHLTPHDEQDIWGALLQKPFTPDELLSAVEDMLTPCLC